MIKSLAKTHQTLPYPLYQHVQYEGIQASTVLSGNGYHSVSNIPYLQQTQNGYTSYQQSIRGRQVKEKEQVYRINCALRVIFKMHNIFNKKEISMKMHMMNTSNSVFALYGYFYIARPHAQVVYTAFLAQSIKVSVLLPFLK